MHIAYLYNCRQILGMKPDMIRKLRKRLNLSQVEMALSLGVTQGTLSRLENGAKASKPVRKLLKQMASR